MLASVAGLVVVMFLVVDLVAQLSTTSKAFSACIKGYFMVRLIGFCLLAAVMTMLLADESGHGGAACVAFGAMTLLMLLPAVGEYAAQIRDFLSNCRWRRYTVRPCSRRWASC
ncbi:MAG: hypothetical protein ACLUI3_14630 [Christensenellales bacterium]